MMGKGAIMTSYRCYLLNASDRIQTYKLIEGTDDGAAKEMAAKLLGETAYPAAEVWELGRRVGHIEQTIPDLLEVPALLDYARRCRQLALRADLGPGDKESLIQIAADMEEWDGRRGGSASGRRV
jgi:hypothetical protein